MRNLLTDVEFRRVSASVAAGQGTTDCTIVDMEGYDEVTFVLALGTVVNDGVVTFQIAHADTNDTGEMAVTTATTGAITSDGTLIALSDKLLAVTVTKPEKRYLEAQVVKATQNAEIDGVIAILSKGRTQPAVQGTTVYDAKLFHTPEDAA